MIRLTHPILAGAVAGALMLPLMLPAAAAQAGAYRRPMIIERVSAAPSGADGNADTGFAAAITPDGRYVAFTSFASNLVPDDHNGTRDVFVRDRETGITERVSVASDGSEGNSISIDPAAISADGRYVAYASYASNLVAGDTNATADVFVHDRHTGITERVSVAADGTEGNGASAIPAISADGRYVAFTSHASNLVPGDHNATMDVFVHDRETGTIEQASVASDGTEANGDSVVPVISADGRYVAFDSLASNLVPGDHNAMRDIFVRDRETGTTERVSVSSDGTEGNGKTGWGAAITPDGRYVAFTSFAFNLVPGDANNVCGTTVTVYLPPGGSPTGAENCADVFVHDRETGTTERVSLSSDGTEGNGASTMPSISADGRHVAFTSYASNLVPGDTNNYCGFSGTSNCPDVFVHDRTTGTTERMSIAADGTEADAGSGSGAISADGRYVAFDSLASNLVSGDANDRRNVFVHERGPAIGIGGLTAQVAQDEFLVSGWATFSGATVAETDDSPDDGVDPVGAEIINASVTYRPELGDLLLRLRLASLPGPIVGGAAGIVYRWSLTGAQTRYEVRMERAGATPDPPSAAPYFALYECAPSCAEVRRLSGGIGTAGADVRVSVPLAALGAEAGTIFSDVQASAALGATSPLVTLDEVTLPDAPIPAPRVELGIAPESASEDDVAFTHQTDVVQGWFSGALNGHSLPPGAYRLWARACIADACGTRSVLVVP